LDHGKILAIDTDGAIIVSKVDIVADMTIVMLDVQIERNVTINMDQNHLQIEEAEKDNK
jgi:hypothetical protein